MLLNGPVLAATHDQKRSACRAHPIARTVKFEVRLAPRLDLVFRVGQWLPSRTRPRFIEHRLIDW